MDRGWKKHGVRETKRSQRTMKTIAACIYGGLQNATVCLYGEISRKKRKQNAISFSNSNGNLESKSLCARVHVQVRVCAVPPHEGPKFVKLRNTAGFFRHAIRCVEKPPPATSSEPLVAFPMATPFPRLIDFSLCRDRGTLWTGTAAQNTRCPTKQTVEGWLWEFGRGGGEKAKVLSGREHEENIADEAVAEGLAEKTTRGGWKSVEGWVWVRNRHTAGKEE